VDFSKRMLEEITKKGQEPDWNMEEIFFCVTGFSRRKRKR